MNIQWLGGNGFKLQLDKTIVVIDPYGDDVGLRQSPLKADIVLSSGFASLDISRVKPTEEKVVVIDSPGEYESHGIFVYGVEGKAGNLFVLNAQGVTIGHCAGISGGLSNAQLEYIEGVDVLLLPVGGHGVLDAKKAPDVISQIEPRVVIPMDYAIKGYKPKRNEVDAFFKEVGAKDTVAVEKIRIIHKDLPVEETVYYKLLP